MTTRPELVQMCDELKIDHDGLSSAKMKAQVIKVSDKLLKSRKIKHSAEKLSVTLRKFLTLEYDYKIYNQAGTELDYNLKDKNE